MDGSLEKDIFIETKRRSETNSER